MHTYQLERLICHIVNHCIDNLAVDEDVVECVKDFMENDTEFQEYQAEQGKEYSVESLLSLAKNSIGQLNSMLSEITDIWD